MDEVYSRSGNFLMVQWLRHCASTDKGSGSILVRELRSCMLYGVDKKEIKTNKIVKSFKK